MIFESDRYLSQTKNNAIFNCWHFLGFASLFQPLHRAQFWKEYKRNFNDSASLFESDRDFLDNLHRISNGLLKISFFSQPLLVFILFVANLEIKTPENELLYFSFLSVVAVIYLYFLYINFSSFCDVMIGSGRLLGLHVPENLIAHFPVRIFEFGNIGTYLYLDGFEILFSIQ